MNKQIWVVVLSFTFLMGCSGTIPKLGVTNEQLTQCPKTPNCVNSQAADKQHFIQPIAFNGASQEAQNRLLQILKALKRSEITVNKENYIRVEFTSAFFRFIDDVEFYFPLAKTEKTIIQIRSASRIGRSDFGANRKRMEQIRDKFKASE